MDQKVQEADGRVCRARGAALISPFLEVPLLAGGGKNVGELVFMGPGSCRQFKIPLPPLLDGEVELR